MNVYELARRHRRRLLDGESAAMKELIERYGQGYLFLLEESGRWHSQIQARANELGVPIDQVAVTDPSWPFRAGNLDAQRAAISKELADLASRGAIATEQLQGMGVRFAMDDAREQAAQAAADRLRGSADQLRRAKKAIEGVWSTPPKRAFEALVGQVADGTPLTSLFARSAGQAALEMEQTLLAGFLLGQGPDVIGRGLAKSLDGNLYRGTRIARTEVIRAYRMGLSTSFQENPAIVGGWTWHSALDGNTCLACALNHGTRHEADEVLSDHVQGRCAMVPFTQSWEDLGKTFGVDLTGMGDTSLSPKMRSSLARAGKAADEGTFDGWIKDRGDFPTLNALESRGYLEYGDPGHTGMRSATVRPREWRITPEGRKALGSGEPIVETTPKIEDGITWLKAQVPAVQDRMMGPTRGRLFREGRVEPGDLIRKVDDPVWGQSWQVTPLKDLPTKPPTKPVVPDPTPPKPLEVVPDEKVDPAIPDDVIETTTDRSRYVIQVGDDSPAWLRELSDEIGEGLPDHQAAIRAGAIMDRELKGRIEDAVLRRRVTLADPRIATLEAQVATRKKRLTSYKRRKFGPTTIESAAADLREAEAELAAYKASAQATEGSIAELLAAAQTRVDEVDARWKAVREAQRNGEPGAGERYWEVSKELAEAKKAVQMIYDLEDDIRQDVVKDFLAEIRATDTVKQDWTAGGAVPKAMDEDIAHLYPEGWLRQAADYGPMKPGKVQRGFYRHGRPADFKISGEAGTHDFLDTVTHEYGHRVEYTVKGERSRELAIQPWDDRPPVTLADSGESWRVIVDYGSVKQERAVTLESLILAARGSSSSWVDDAIEAGVRSGAIDDDTAQAVRGLKGGDFSVEVKETVLRPGIRDLEKQLYDDWTAGVKGVAKDGGRFRPTREGVADWPLEYAGKAYPDGRAYEIFTTGMEAVRRGGVYQYGSKRLFYSDMNPELWRFILGTWAGVV